MKPTPTAAPARINQHTPTETWKLSIARYSDDAPPYGFGIKAEGKTPFVASAGIAQPNHSLIVPEEFRANITTGFSEAEVVANANLMFHASKAIDRAARTLGVDAAELAERLDLARLINEAERCREIPAALEIDNQFRAILAALPKREGV